MRVLFVALPMLGHLFPMMPLVTALADAGQQTLIATGGDAAACLRRDLRHRHIVVDDCLPRPRFNYTLEAMRGLAAHPREARRGAAGAADPDAAGLVFAVVNRPMVEPLVSACVRLRPDLVVHDPYAAAAAVAADRLGLPAIVHNVALNDGAVLLDRILRRLAPDLAARHVPAATLSMAPPSVEPVPGTLIRYQPYSIPDSGAPQWLLNDAARPRIVVTRSTSLGDGRNRMLSSMARAAADVDAEIVIVRPNRPILRATKLAPNIRTVPWIPLHTVLHTCAGMINHGGAGSVYAAMWAGIPQIATPAPGDRRWNATLISRRGIGLAVPAGHINADHLGTLISDTRLTGQARAVAAEIAAMPGVAEVAETVIRLG